MGTVWALRDLPSSRADSLWEREPILSTTGTRAAIDLLAARTEMLEEVVRELTMAVEDLTQPERRDSLT